LRYRELVELDIEAIARVHRQTCLIAYAFMNWSYSEDEVRRWYAEKFKIWDWGMVAADDEGVAAFIACTGDHLDQLFIDPGRQRRGIGTFLLKAAMGKALPVRTLNVFEQNIAARRFYERHGFHEIELHYNEDENAMELVYAR
jgi:GNAT superfamily N-acetyltransferase